MSPDSHPGLSWPTEAAQASGPPCSDQPLHRGWGMGQILQLGGGWPTPSL